MLSGDKKMNTMLDVRQLLKRFGTFIYTGDRLGDLDLMEQELNELYQWEFISQAEYQMAKLCVKRERTNDKKGKS